MRKNKMLAFMMAAAMTASIYSPVQAAGYCANTNGSNCQIIVGGNCLNGNSVNGASNNNCNNSNLLKDVLSNSSCNNGNSVKGASDSSCNNSNIVKEILKNSSCNSGNSVKGASDSNCNNGSCASTNNSCNIVNGGSCSNSSNSCSTLNGGSCANAGSSCNNSNNAGVKGSKDNKGSSNTGSNSTAALTNQSSCVQNGKVYKIVVSNGCQSVTQTATEQPSTQVTNPSTEQPKTQVTTEQPVTEKPVAEKPVAEQPSTGQEKTTEEKTEEKSDVTKPENPTADDKTSASMSEDQGAAAASVLNLVNQNRSSAGLHSLKLDSSLCAAAQIRANEIVSSFSHTRPDGRKFSTVLTDNGIRFTAAGENIAWGQRSPEEVMSAWMNSDGHRANIMNQTYTKLGVGHVTVNGRQYWVQLFSY